MLIACCSCRKSSLQNVEFVDSKGLFPGTGGAVMALDAWVNPVRSFHCSPTTDSSGEWCFRRVYPSNKWRTKVKLAESFESCSCGSEERDLKSLGASPARFGSRRRQRACAQKRSYNFGRRSVDGNLTHYLHRKLLTDNHYLMMLRLLGDDDSRMMPDTIGATTAMEMTVTWS